jgi:hypothetical protein
MEKTIKEAAVLLGRSPRVLQQMCRDGAVPARREGRGWLVDVSGLVPGGRRRRSAERPPPAECPRQQAVANRVGEVLDIFSGTFVCLAREERLSVFAPAEDAGARWRNAVRMAALGMVVRLGRDLGLATNDLHGDERLRGRTQVPELQSVQRTTSLSALRMCDAMLEDQGDMPVVARERYESIRDRARADVVAARPKNPCACRACRDDRAK